MSAIDDVLKYIATNEIRWIDLQFFGVDGTLHRTSISNRKIEEDTFGKGTYIADLQEVYGKSDQGELVLLPDPDTLARIPWEPTTVRFLCDVIAMPEKERYLKDSRYVAERMETNLSAAGIAYSKVGTGADCYIFDTVTMDRTSAGRGVGALLDSRESYWGPSPLSSRKDGAYVAQPFDSLYAARCQASETLEDSFGVMVDSHKHGRSPTGQQTFQLAERGLKAAADGMSTFKFVVRNLANAVNASCTFMPLPVEGERGNRLEIPVSLWKTAENNLFYDAKDDYAQISQAGRYYIGGLLEHAPALSLFTAPIPNSYKRLAAEGTVAGWSAHDRSALVGVPYAKKNAKDTKRIVYAGADPSVNPYLAYAAVVAAGLDGMKNKIDPGDPVEEEGKKKRISKELPTDLYGAIEALESDTKFIKGVFPAELLEEYLDLKLKQHKADKKAVSMQDHKRYYNV